MPDTTKYTVSGIIYDEHSSPLAKAQVKIYEVDLRSEKLLGTVIADAKGRYSFGFTGARWPIVFFNLRTMLVRVCDPKRTVKIKIKRHFQKEGQEK